jgi:hypothetical protein
MSWFSKNYEKAALGGAVAVALGLAYLGWSKFGSVEQDFPPSLTGGGNNNTAVRGADAIPQALASLRRDRAWTQALDGERPVDLFTGIPLFISSEAPEKSLDLLKDPALHAPIPNGWWVDNRLDPGFADSPRRDPDQDGFSNLEEFNAKTDPNNAKSYPPLIAKLMYVKDESLTWVLRPGYGGEGKFPFNYRDSKGQTNKNDAANMVAPGELFFAKAPMLNRFKLLGSEVRKEMNKATKTEKDVTIVRIEDQRPNKKGVIYEIPSPLSEERMNEHLKYDRTAVLSLEAIGLGGKDFKVEENTAFSLPPDSGKKDYLAKTVTADSIVVEYTDPAGEKKTVTINKGSLPQMAD